MDDYLSFAKSLAYEAGKIIKKNFDTVMDVETKSDDSPVTKVDKAINKLVIERVRAAYPDHGIMGEEEDYGDGSETFQWLTDPLDGTKPFILGIPCSVFMLGLATHGEMQLSVIYEPHFDKLYYAVKGKGTFCNDEPIHVSDQPLDGGHVLMGSSTHLFAPELTAAGAKLEPVPGGGYKAALIARGKAVASLRKGADFHDVGPAALLIEEAGGKVTGLNGETMLYDKPIAGVIFSNGVSHDELVAIVQAKYADNATT